jgi:hypothetical protein
VSAPNVITLTQHHNRLSQGIAQQKKLDRIRALVALV